MKNKLILHIGTQKTGSSAIQKFLYDNQALLNEKGFSYPCIIPDLQFFWINGYTLQKYVDEAGVPNMNEASWQEFWDIVRQHLRKNHVILSWEGMFAYDKKFFTAIKNQYDNIKIIIYLRRQDRYLESLWNQHIKGWRLNTLDFEQFANKNIWQVEYLSILDTIKQIVGKNNIIVRVYEKNQFQGSHKIISDFTCSLGIDLDWDRCTFSNKPSNMALFGNYIEIKRHINYSLYKNNFIGNNINYSSYENDPISNNINFIFSKVRTLFKSSEIKHAEGLFTEAERKQFLKQFAEQNAEIAQKYLGRSDGILFYENKAIPMLKIDPNTLCSDIQNVFMFFFKDIEQKIFLLTDLQNARNIKQQIFKELEKVQNKQLNQSDFQIACFQLVQNYTSKLIEIYQKIYSNIENIGNIKKTCDRKKGFQTLYFFGTGGFCDRFIRVLPKIEIGIEPDAFLDNNKEKIGLSIYKKPILHPSQIQDWKNCFVLITIETPDIIMSVEQQLQQYGLKKNEDYIVLAELF